MTKLMGEQYAVIRPVELVLKDMKGQRGEFPSYHHNEYNIRFLAP